LGASLQISLKEKGGERINNSNKSNKGEEKKKTEKIAYLGSDLSFIVTYNALKLD